MNARLRKTFGFYTGLVYDGRFMANHYTVEIGMLTVSSDNAEQNTAYERAKFWIYNVLGDSILINHQDPKVAAYESTGARLMIFPDEPVDQNVGIMLYLKLNSIMENRMVVTDIEICSSQGDEASYLHQVGESLGMYFSQDGWWTDSRPICAPIRERSQDKVVTLDRIVEWSDHGLTWNTQDQRSAVIAPFPRNEDQ